MDKERLQPAIIGGVTLGILSAIPGINLLNACCCAWAILGGLLAGYLYVKRSQTPVRIGEGAKIGAIAGGIGGLISVVVGVPLTILLQGVFASLIVSTFGNEAQSNPMLAEYFRQLQSGPLILQLLAIGIGRAVLLAGFATVGAILGVALFEKRPTTPEPPPPPPPPPFPPGSGGGQESGYSAGYGAGGPGNYGSAA
ncbi:MAG TPA: hypothetical protein VGX92_00020 [Pyrinomonadaceae bacterium]|jgi:hypothetical protein|nr:hypothetical protein [Pyrinomonadaceae bacterium]